MEQKCELDDEFSRFQVVVAFASNWIKLVSDFKFKAEN